MATPDTRTMFRLGQTPSASKTASGLTEEDYAEMEREFKAMAKPTGERTVRYGGLTIEDYEEDQKMASEALRRGLSRLRAKSAKMGQNPQA